MTQPTADIKSQIFLAIVTLLEKPEVVITDDTPLIGDASMLDSMKLVELCLQLEDIAVDAGFEFDWTSDTAMSKSKSMFRTAGSLAAEFISQMSAKS